jgi:RNA polymerase sigma factor (sigma-70 family)
MVNGRLEAVAVNGDSLGAAVEPSDRELLGRFVDFRDEQAFATIVRRHGPMVFGVCRRVLDNAQDAEDAFQATFVVLARKGHAVQKPELLANWLYGVAYRTARKARAQASRRGHHERQAALMAGAEAPQAAENWQEIREVIDEELQHLPPKYRVPLVLCYLEGMTNEQAARRLGWPAGSMSYRLARGRELLRGRLTRRAKAFPASDFDATLAEVTVPVGVPEPLVEATVKGALGDAGRPNLSPAVLALVAATQQAAATSGWLTAAKAAVIVLALLGVAAAGVYSFGLGPPARRFAPPNNSMVAPLLPGSPSPDAPSPGGCHAAQPSSAAE